MMNAADRVPGYHIRRIFRISDTVQAHVIECENSVGIAKGITVYIQTDIVARDKVFGYRTGFAGLHEDAVGFIAGDDVAMGF